MNKLIEAVAYMSLEDNLSEELSANESFEGCYLIWQILTRKLFLSVCWNRSYACANHICRVQNRVVCTPDQCALKWYLKDYSVTVWWGQVLDPKEIPAGLQMWSTNTGFLACADLPPVCFSLLSLFACNTSRAACSCKGTSREQVQTLFSEALSVTFYYICVAE